MIGHLVALIIALYIWAVLPTEKEPTLASNSKEAANAKFKKAERAQEGVQARAQYETDARAVREKTTRLRSLRLAKEAAEMETRVKPIGAVLGEETAALATGAASTAKWGFGPVSWAAHLRGRTEDDFIQVSLPIENLARMEVDERGSALRFGDSKTGDSTLPIGNMALNVLREALGKAKSEYVFPSPGDPSTGWSAAP
jgi:hypothetical protein